MKIVFFIPPPVSPDHPLLGVASLAALAVNMGHEVTVFDLNARLYNEGLKETKFWQKESFDCWSELEFVQNMSEYLREKIKCFAKGQESPPEILALHVNDTSKEIAIFCVREFLQLYPHLKIIAGGPAFFNVSGQNVLHDPFNIVICGEGETAFKEWLENSSKNEKEVIYGKKQSLDDLPFPEYGKFPLDIYARKDVFPVETSRGCTNYCGFCNDVLMWGKRRKKSLNRLLKEMEILKHRYGNIHISFCDSLLNASKVEFINLLQLLRGFNFKWDGMIQVEGIDSESAEKMYACGCEDVFIGIESFSENFLRNINKTARTANAAKVIRELSDAGIRPSIGLIVGGYPFQSRSEFEYDLNTIRELAECLKTVAVNPLCIPVGTFLWRNREKYGIKQLEGPKGWKFWQGSNGFLDIETRYSWCLEASEKLIEYGIQGSANYTNAKHYFQAIMDEAKEYTIRQTEPRR